MKAKVTIISALALLLGACTTGNYVTDRYDDIYFTPGDVPPPVIVDPVPADQTMRNSTVAPLVTQEPNYDETGSPLYENHVFTTNNKSADLQHYDMSGMELVDSDTTLLSNEDTDTYIINNYYEAEDINFAYRINRFHRFGYYSPYSWYYDPFFYDPYYYDPFYYDYWYSPGWSFGLSWGWGYPYYGSYWGNSWYWGSSYYGGWGYPYYAGHYHSYPYYSDDYRYGHRRANYSTVRNSEYGTRSSYNTLGRRTSSSFDTTDRSRVAGVRSSSAISSGRSLGTTTKSATIMDRRRDASSNGVSTSNGRSISTSTDAYNRTNRSTQAASQTPVVRQSTQNRATSGNASDSRYNTTTQKREYTPSYTKPRTVTRSSYNNSSYNKSGSSYTKPSSGTQTQQNSNYRSTYNSGTTYQKGSSQSSGSRTSPSYSTPSRSSNSSYSTPSRSSGSYSSPSNSSGSYSGGSRSSGSSSGSGSSGGGSSSRSGGRR